VTIEDKAPELPRIAGLNRHPRALTRERRDAAILGGRTASVRSHGDRIESLVAAAAVMDALPQRHRLGTVIDDDDDRPVAVIRGINASPLAEGVKPARAEAEDGDGDNGYHHRTVQTH